MDLKTLTAENLNFLNTTKEMTGVVFSHKADPKDGQQAQVYISGVFNPDDIKNPMVDLPWLKVSIGEHNGSQGKVPTLHAGQRVLVKSVDSLTWEVIGITQEHEPKKGRDGQAASQVHPSSGMTKDTPQNKTNISNEINNEYILNLDVPNLATGYLNLLRDSLFAKVENMLFKLENFHFDFSSLLRGFSAYRNSNVQNDEGFIDLSKDYFKAVDYRGGSIGKIQNYVKINGHPVLPDHWKVEITSAGCLQNTKGFRDLVQKAYPSESKDTSWTDPYTGSNKDPDLCSYQNDYSPPEGSNQGWHLMKNGDIIIPPGIREGIHQIEYTLSRINNIKNDINQIKGIIQFKVFKDFVNVNFEESINYFKDKITKLGSMNVSKLMPKISIQLNPKGTDKGTFGQIHLETGPADLSVSLEMDFTTGFTNHDKNILKKQKQKGRDYAGC
ncbi:MAG: hypothetical protein DRI86_05610 [Bacteroidetes bacterium]|nr:MAG: hypothetical protein DRI86_05610 [Bacteroidota bacterium]